MSEIDPVAAARRVISLIDLTDLNDERRPDALAGLVERALAHRVPAVCVWPEFVSEVAAGLGVSSGCEIATVVNFPSGDEPIDHVVATTEQALEDGATEVDLVLPYRRFIAGDTDAAGETVATVAAVVHDSSAHLKVILETGELAEADLIEAASRLAIDAGADFIKTSTGKSPVSATPEAFVVMVEVVSATDRVVGLKPSGGIRTVDQASEYLAIAEATLGEGWATPATFRFGASGLLDDAIAVIDAR